MNKAVRSFLLRNASKGGKARAAKLSTARKSAIAKQAAAIRWQREKDPK